MRLNPSRHSVPNPRNHCRTSALKSQSSWTITEQIVINAPWANAEQVRRGMAWAYKQYLTDQAIGALEDTARASKTGLWADESPTPPWEFRHGGKTAKATKKLSVKKVSANDSGFECGSKSRCGDMSGCAEAEFYLNKCGLTRLDRDHDGVPCESLCK
jgi:hypothetical protein